MAQCIVPGCNNPAPYYLGVRLRRPTVIRNGRRRPSGTAIWAPNCDAHICEVHASQGYKIDITLTPIVTKQIITNTSVVGGNVITKKSTINHLP